MEPKTEKHHHHILPNRAILTIGGSLLVLTLITVWSAGIDLGVLNFPLAMLIATSKASLVALFFMNLLYDRKENAVIFVTSFLFLAIFIAFTISDLYFRGDVYVKAGDLAPKPQGPSRIKSPWIATPDLVSKGKELFQAQCVACHGPEGKGNGPAAASLNPPPRNFTADEGWKVGRKASDVFKVLKEGIPGTSMSSFGSLPADDRWALVHYVQSLMPSVPEASPADFAAVGVDITKESGGVEVKAKTIPIELAMERMAVRTPRVLGVHVDMRALDTLPGAELYKQHCAGCHGNQGQGGIRVRSLGGLPHAFVETMPFAATQSATNEARFNEIVQQGYPGYLMPGFAQLSSAQLSDIHQYVRALAAPR